jgi:hypothetical protein
MTTQRCPLVKAVASILSALISGGLGDARIEDDRFGQSTNMLTVQIDGAPYRLTVDPDTGDRPTNIVFARWRKPEVDPRLGPVFDPLPETHAAYYERCIVCDRQLGNGKEVQLLAIGPTPADLAAHGAGQEYGAQHAICHKACLQGEAPPVSPTE